MAIIISGHPGNGEYQKIILERCFININGLYVTAVVFKDKAERDKDKARSPLIQEFVSRVRDAESRMREEEAGRPEGYEVSEEEITANTRLVNAAHLANNIDRVSRRWTSESDEDRLQFPEDVIQEAERHGFDREWSDDPVMLVREETFWTDNYKGQEFTLQSFYDSVRDNVYIRNGVQVEDDI